MHTEFALMYVDQEQMNFADEWVTPEVNCRGVVGQNPVDPVARSAIAYLHNYLYTYTSLCVLRVCFGMSTVTTFHNIEFLH